MDDFSDDEEQVLDSIKRKNRYSTSPLNRNKISKYELDALFLDSEHSVLILED